MLETKFIIDIFIVIFTDCWTAGPSLPRLCILVRAIPAQMIPMFRIDSVLTNSQAPSCTHNSCSCACIGTDKADVCSSFLHAPAEAASGAVITEVTSASMSMSLGHGVTVAAAVMTTGGNADSALAEVLDRVVPAPTSRWAAMIEEAPVRVNFCMCMLILHLDFVSRCCILILHPDVAS